MHATNNQERFLASLGMTIGSGLLGLAQRGCALSRWFARRSCSSRLGFVEIRRSGKNQPTAFAANPVSLRNASPPDASPATRRWTNRPCIPPKQFSSDAPIATAATRQSASRLAHQLIPRNTLLQNRKLTYNPAIPLFETEARCRRKFSRNGSRNLLST